MLKLLQRNSSKLAFVLYFSRLHELLASFKQIFQENRLGDSTQNYCFRVVLIQETLAKIRIIKNVVNKLEKFRFGTYFIEKGFQFLNFVHFQIRFSQID